LTFVNTAVRAGAATPPAEYRLAWFMFDNTTGEHTAVGEEIALRETNATLPAELAEVPFAGLSLRAEHPDHEGWGRTTRVYFRREGRTWQTVGVERMDERPGARATDSSR
jgi:hypothetical protein